MSPEERNTGVGPVTFTEKSKESNGAVLAVTQIARPTNKVCLVRRARAVRKGKAHYAVKRLQATV